MSKAPQSDKYAPQITQQLAEFVTRLQFEDLSNAAIEISKHCLLDWIGVTVAGLDEDEAAELNMTARAPWFEEAEVEEPD